MEKKEAREEISFYDMYLDDRVLDGLEAMNFRKPSPVQAAAIPPILEGRDVIACAQTGTGKTAAFVLPILSELASGEYPEEYVNAIVMAPTRELAQQIDQQIEAFSYFVSDVSAVPIYGGTGGVEWEQQKRALRLGADIVIATPGRLLSHIGLNTVDLSRVSFFVLDEADRMLDMGFYDDIIEVYKLLPEDVQTVMFSATMPDKIRRLAKQITRNPAEVNIAISRPPESIDQSAYFCRDEDKLGLLVKIFEERKPDKCIVFFASKERVKQAKRMLAMHQHKVSEMHSDLAQDEREEVMRAFKSGHINIIVATDIISRGIDVTDIDLIVNFDVPTDPEDYVHRIGRTARGNNEAGAAITIVCNKDKARFLDIENFLGYTIKRNELPEGFTPIGSEPQPAPAQQKNRRGARAGAKGNSRRGTKPRRDGAKQGKAKSKAPQRTSDKATGKEASTGKQQRNRRSRNRQKANKPTTTTQATASDKSKG